MLVIPKITIINVLKKLKDSYSIYSNEYSFELSKYVSLHIFELIHKKRKSYRYTNFLYSTIYELLKDSLPKKKGLLIKDLTVKQLINLLNRAIKKVEEEFPSYIQRI